MPGNQHPLGFAKSIETKVVRLGANTRKRCYISKVYKIPQNCEHHSPFFGSILMELIPETERVKAFICVTILPPAPPVGIWNIVIPISFPNDVVWWRS